MPLVGIIMGSSSDRSVMEETAEVLNQLGIAHEVEVMSAHRTPDKVREYGKTARDRGIEVIIAGAGGSAGLPWRSGVVDHPPDHWRPDTFERPERGRCAIRDCADAARNTGRVRSGGILGREKCGVPRGADARWEARSHQEILRRLPRGPQKPLTRRCVKMIDRYARTRMKRVWSDQSKYDKWLLIELAVCEAWSKAGVIPAEDIQKLSAARYDIDRLNEVLSVTKHDMTAFLRSVTEQLGPEGRWLHLGLTTSDVWDTATSLQMVDAADLLIEEASSCIDALAVQASRHKGTLMMGRTHGVHAEPTTLGLKLALWWDEMRRNRTRLIRARDEIAVGKISGPVGTHATVPPEIEAAVCDRLGLSAAPVSNQVIQRDRHATFVTTLAVAAASLEKFATES